MPSAQPPGGSATGVSCAGRDVDEREASRARRDAVAARRVVLAARPRLDAHAGELEERLGDLRDRRIVDPRHEQDRVARRADIRLRRRRRVQHVEHVLRRLVVAGCRDDLGLVWARHRIDRVAGDTCWLSARLSADRRAIRRWGRMRARRHSPRSRSRIHALSCEASRDTSAPTFTSQRRLRCSGRDTCDLCDAHQPTQTRALRNIRIHGLSSPHSRGCHDSCTVRNTRSGCGMIIVTRPSGGGHRGDAVRRAVRVRRVASRDVAATVDEARGDEALRLERRELRRGVSSARPSPCAFAIGMREPAMPRKKIDGLSLDPRASRRAPRTARCGCARTAASARAPRRRGPARGRRPSGSRCTRRAGTCRRGRRTSRIAVCARAL